MSCEWHVAVAPGTPMLLSVIVRLYPRLGNKVRLQFTMIDDLESADSNGLCAPFARNYIDVLEGPDNLLKRYCRKENAPSPIEADGNELIVRYNQHGGSHHGPLYGFLAHFGAGIAALHQALDVRRFSMHRSYADWILRHAPVAWISGACHGPASVSMANPNLTGQSYSHCPPQVQHRGPLQAPEQRRMLPQLS